MWDINQKATNEQTKQTKQLIDTDNIMVVTRGEGRWRRTNRIKEVKCMVMEGD